MLQFFQRRRILKNTNSLDLTPVRLIDSETNPEGKTDILLPRFKNDMLKRALQPRRKGEYIRIHLDELGSVIWQGIDGNTTLHDLCLKLLASHPEKLNPPEETEERVSNFIALLYRERYITFREFSEEK